jgi:glycosyltransferase involved in cell wall biosynthesis
MYAGFPSKLANVHQRINTCYALAATGLVEVHIVYPSHKNNTLVEVLSNYDLKIIPGLFLWPVVPSHKFWKSGFPFRAYSRISLILSTMKLILHNKGNVLLFGRDIEYLSMLMPWAHSIHCPVIFESHGISSVVQSEYKILLGKKLPKNTFARLIYALQEQYTLKTANAIICTTNNLKRILSTEFAINESKLFVIPNAATDVSKTDLRRDSGVPDKFAKCNCTRVLYTGQFYPWKGVDLIIESASYLPESFRVYLVGGNNDDDKNRLLEVARKSGVLERVIFIGQVTFAEARRLQINADILILSLAPGNVESDKFTSPIKIFEYMASNRPIVAPNLPMIREVLEHGRNAWLYDANNPEDLASAIKYIASNPEIATTIASKAKEDFLNRHTMEKRALRLIEVIDSVL